MKIGIDCRMYRKEVAGIGRYSQNLVKNLLELDKENEYVLFMTENDANEYQKSKIKSQNNKVKIKIVNIEHYSIAEQTKFAKIIEAEKLDLMHFLNFNYPVNYRGKFIVTIHDLTLYFYPETAKETGFIKKRAFYYVMKKACQNSEIIIAVSESTKNDIIKTYKTDKSKIIVIHEAADDKQLMAYSLSLMAKITKEIKTRYAIGDKPVLLSVGQFRPHKNLPGLVKAFDVLKSEIDAKLVILGKPDDKHRIFYQAVKASKFKNDIILPGFVSNEELACFYKTATVFVFPSFYEGFGLPGLEAMQAGLPVVASNKASLPEIYGKAAIYFDPLKIEDIADKMKLVLEDKKLRAKMITEGKVVAQSYSWQKTARETLEVYHENYSN